MVVYSEEFFYKLILKQENPTIENLILELNIKLSTPEETDLKNILRKFRYRKKKKYDKPNHVYF